MLLVSVLTLLFQCLDSHSSHDTASNRWLCHQSYRTRKQQTQEGSEWMKYVEWWESWLFCTARLLVHPELVATDS